MVRLKLERTNYQDKQTLGIYKVIDDENKVIGEFYCLELPWKNNERMVSCIPEGIYPIVKRRTEKRGLHFHILNVPNRSYILIHKGNFHTHILGCQLPGISLADINSDGYLDVTNSTLALEKMLDIMPEKTTIEIVKSKNAK